jgi:predicted nucleotidyltransferase
MKQTQINISICLEKYFKEKENICLALLFGSCAVKRVTTESDVDIAILFQTPPDFYGVQALRDELEVLLKRDVDIAVLNTASPILKMQVLKNGLVIFDKGNKYFSFFTIDTVNQYSDLKMIRKKAEENILKGRIYA